MSLCFSDSLGKQVFSYFSLPPFRSLCFSLFSLWFYIIFYLCLHIYKCIFRLFLSLPLLTSKREAGFIHWSESDWGHSEKWVSVSRSHALLICACTLKLCCRHSNNNSLASINFFGLEQSLLSSLFLSESLTVRRCAHTKTLSLTLNVAYTLSTSASVFLFFSHPPQRWWIPRMTTHPPPLFAPLHSCLSARKQ